MSTGQAVSLPTADGGVRVTMDRATGQMAAVVDGVRQPGLVGLAVDAENVPCGYDVGADGVLQPRYRPGLTTWTVTVDGQPLLVMTAPPRRTEDAFFIRWLWGVELG